MVRGGSSVAMGYLANNFLPDQVWCDDCGDGLGDNYVAIGRLAFPVASANVGESARLCGSCYSRHTGR